VHNDNYHLDHHLDPRTPFYLLPKAHVIRLADKNYAAVDYDTGGLFTPAQNGAPSALSRILQARVTPTSSSSKLIER
jgi:fatty acid desaturase